MGCRVEIAGRIVAHGADYLRALKGNRPTLETNAESYFDTPPAAERVAGTTVEKGLAASRRGPTRPRASRIGSAPRGHPGQPRLTGIETISKVRDRVEYADRRGFETRSYISRAPLDIARLPAGARGHCGVASMPRLRDVVFKGDLSRRRKGNGAKNMAVVRRFALGLVRAGKAQGSIKTKRKAAGWDPCFLLEILQQKRP